jgi:hypothetical protein
METFLSFLDYSEYILGTLSTFLIILQFYTPWADDIENYIDSLEGKFHEIGDAYTAGNFYNTMVMLSIPITIFIIYYYMMQYSPVVSEIHLRFWHKAVLFIILVPCYTGIGLYILSKIISRANEITHGDAIGGIGVFLGFITFIMATLDKILE